MILQKVLTVFQKSDLNAGQQLWAVDGFVKCAKWKTIQK
jgi:hypothetical protein